MQRLLQLPHKMFWSLALVADHLLYLGWLHKALVEARLLATTYSLMEFWLVVPSQSSVVISLTSVIATPTTLRSLPRTLLVMANEPPHLSQRWPQQLPVVAAQPLAQFRQ